MIDPRERARLAKAEGEKSGAVSLSDANKPKAPSAGASGGSKDAKKADDEKKGAGFNYDPSNYKDSNSANYRRLSDQLAAAKAEEEQLLKERDELIKKEKMEAMLLKQEEDIFQNTPASKVVATADKFFIDPNVLQVIADLDNQLIGLKPVC